jgi:hypothetical protein
MLLIKSKKLLKTELVLLIKKIQNLPNGHFDEKPTIERIELLKEAIAEIETFEKKYIEHI